jgi:Holliday junction resolvase RusA-like endonuclease
MSNPWDNMRESFLFQKAAGEYDFPIYSQPKQRHGPNGSKAATRNWEALIGQAAEDQAPRVIPTGPIGLRALFLCERKSGDLSNMIKSLEDALNRRAFHDDDQIDYLEVLRVYGTDVPNRILVKVLEKVNGSRS